MHIFERAHAYHRVWRYRLRTERQEIAYLLSRNLRGATVADIGAKPFVQGLNRLYVARKPEPGRP